jgi:hypothetical protein
MWARDLKVVETREGLSFVRGWMDEWLWRPGVVKRELLSRENLRMEKRLSGLRLW